MKQFSFAALASIVCVLLSFIAVQHSIKTAIIVGISAFVVTYLAVRKSSKDTKRNNDTIANRLDALLDADVQMKESITNQFTALNQNINAFSLKMSAVLEHLAYELKTATEESHKSIIVSIDSIEAVFESQTSDLKSEIDSLKYPIRDNTEAISTANTEIGKRLTQGFSNFENCFGVFSDFYQKMDAFSQLMERSVVELKKEQNVVLSSMTDSIQTIENEALERTKSFQSMMETQITSLQDACSDQTADVKELMKHIKEAISDTLGDIKDNSDKQTQTIKTQVGIISDRLTDMFDQIQEQMITLYTSSNQEELKIMEEMQKICSK